MPTLNSKGSLNETDNFKCAYFWKKLEEINSNLILSFLTRYFFSTLNSSVGSKFV